MKKIILFMLTFGIIGCSNINLKENDNTGKNNNKYAKIENYTCPMDTTFTAKFYKDYSKVDIETAADETFTLVRIKQENKYYRDSEGRSLNIDGKKVTIEMVKNKAIICNVFGDK